MDEVYLWKLAATLNYENIIFIVKCLVGIRLIILLLGAWSLIYEEREAISLVGQLEAILSGKTLKINWDVVYRAIIKWAFIFIMLVFHKEILHFVMR